MPSDPIARWESEGGSILAIERLRLASRSGAPRHMADDSDASEGNLDERRDALVLCAVVALAGVALLLPVRRSQARLGTSCECEARQEILMQLKRMTAPAPLRQAVGSI